MVTKDDIQVFFKSDKWIKAELEYLIYHYSAIRNNGEVVDSCAEQPREDADLFYKAAC